jgi:hypothetical protein
MTNRAGRRTNRLSHKLERKATYHVKRMIVVMQDANNQASVYVAPYYGVPYVKYEETDGGFRIKGNGVP